MPSFTNDPVVSTSNSSGSPAVLGEGNHNEGVRGISHNTHGAVVGINDFGPKSTLPNGPADAGGTAGFFLSLFGEGVRGGSQSPFHGGVVAVNTGGAPALYAEGIQAAFFKGDVVVSGGDVTKIVDGKNTTVHTDGNVNVSGTVTAKDFGIRGEDCAETFEVAEELADPGTVMVIGQEGSLHPCREAYDRRVGGVISGAGSFGTGITLGKHLESETRKPIALIGKVYCKADADRSPIDVGDLLTTSGTPGHAMKATDGTKAFGSVLGKALAPLRTGKGLIPILVTLQ